MSGGPFVPGQRLTATDLDAALAAATAAADIITASDSTTPRSLADRADDYGLNVLDFGAVCDGVSDDTAAVNTAIATVMARGGGTLRFPPGMCHMTGAIVIPFSGSPKVTQPPLRLTGCGALQNGQWSASGLAGSSIDCRYGGGGSQLAKIDTRGSGVLEIDHLSLVDRGTSNFLFIRSTGTTLLLHDMTIIGNFANTRTACVQNAIQLGGTSATLLGTADDTAGFQGYGTRLSNIYFEFIQTGVSYGSAANATRCDNLTFSATCGSATTGAYVFQGCGTGVIGNTVFGGIIEMTGYKYGVVFQSTDSINWGNHFNGIGLWDEVMGAPTVAGFLFDANSVASLIIPGFVSNALEPTLLSGPGAPSNNLINLAWYASNLNGITKVGNITGVGLSWVSNTVLGIAVGTATDSGGFATIALPTAFTKSIAGVWASGTGANGMGTGLTASASTWYRVFLATIAGLTDVFYDTSATAANKPAGTTAFRQIGWFKLDGAVHIIPFDQYGDRFDLRTPTQEVAVVPGVTTATTVTLTAAPPAPVPVMLSGRLTDATATNAVLYVSSLAQADVAASSAALVAITSGVGTFAGFVATVMTNASGQLRYRTNSTTGNVVINTNGWIDTRGRG